MTMMMIMTMMMRMMIMATTDECRAFGGTGRTNRGNIIPVIDRGGP
jgi:hypothetical protein